MWSRNNCYTLQSITKTSPPKPQSVVIPLPNNKSPILQAESDSNALFHDMKICINQRPRSEKGFGFTVRGGDNGKPVIVDTVSSGKQYHIVLLQLAIVKL